MAYGLELHRPKINVILDYWKLNYYVIPIDITLGLIWELFSFENKSFVKTLYRRKNWYQNKNKTHVTVKCYIRD